MNSFSRSRSLSLSVSQHTSQHTQTIYSWSHVVRPHYVQMNFFCKPKIDICLWNLCNILLWRFYDSKFRPYYCSDQVFFNDFRCFLKSKKTMTNEIGKFLDFFKRTVRSIFVHLMLRGFIYCLWSISCWYC